MKRLLANIVEDIKEGGCVLIIGPDMIKLGDQTVFEALSQDFLQEGLIHDSLPYIFKNEELVQFQPNARPMNVIRLVEEFYARQSAFDEPLRKIAAIPFHLIVSLLPDKRLQRTFQEQKLDYSYSFYPPGQNNPEAVDTPTPKKPLIYNLLGDLQKKVAILTFEQMFNFLSGMMGKRELPLNMQEVLKNARSLLFLGVNFEKWYAQLLLRTMASDDTNSYTIAKNDKDGINTFIAHRLSLDFVPNDPLEFLDELYQACNDEQLLKTQKTTQKVFISYSHADYEAVRHLPEKLSGKTFEVIIDETSMLGGQNIEQFIEKISDVDIVMPILSIHSLSSPWVVKEIDYTLTRTNKMLLPFTLDRALLEPNLLDDAAKLAQEKIRAIDTRISQRGAAGIDDLHTERQRWSTYIHLFPQVVDALAKVKCNALLDHEGNLNMTRIMEDMNNLIR